MMKKMDHFSLINLSVCMSVCVCAQHQTGAKSPLLRPS